MMNGRNNFSKKMTDIKRQNTVYCVLPELNDVLMFALRILKESGTYCTKTFTRDT